MPLGSLKNALRSAVSNLFYLRLLKDLQETSRDTRIQALRAEIAKSFPEDIVLKGYSVYSQNDEDGILAHIFETLNIVRPSFFEFGVSPTENNTLLLLLRKSRGVWFDKSLTSFKPQIAGKKSLLILDEFIKLNNIGALIDKGLSFLNVDRKELDLLSLDLDGNDFHFIRQIFDAGVRPKVFCLEYNAKFPLPVDISVAYNENHGYDNDDYFGCSLQAYITLLKNEYTLLTCSLNGTNCFFIRNDLAAKFTCYTPADLYREPRYFLSPFPKGHASSTKFIQLID